jgi:hypothetical protein
MFRDSREDQGRFVPRWKTSAKLADAWMNDTGANLTKLASLLKVDHSTLSRYLNSEETSYKPSAKRPRMLEILEGIERICRTPAIIDWRADQIDGSVTLEQRYADWHYRQLKSIHDATDLPPAAKLIAVDIPFAQAIYGPFTHQHQMIPNWLLVAGDIINRLEPGDASQSLLEETISRIRKLQEMRLTDHHHMPRLRVKNYGGFCLFHCGYLLREREAQADGFDSMLESIRIPCGPSDAITFWENLFLSLDRVLADCGTNHPSEKGIDQAEEWSLRAADAARALGGDSFQVAIMQSSFQSFTDHWQSVAPDLLPAASHRRQKFNS